MRLYLLTDLEGVGGVDRWDPHTFGAPDADRIKAEMLELLRGEVNAAVEGALAGGASEVRVLDGHGSGRNLEPGDLHPGAHLIRRGSERAWLHGLDDSVDLLAFVGQHAMEGAEDAVLAHSWSALNPRRCFLNGREVGEIGAAVFLAAVHGARTVFLAGDRAAVGEVGDLVPGVVTVTVKEGGAGGVTHRSAEAVRDEIRAGLERAVSEADAIPFVRIDDPPFSFREVFVRPPAAGLPFLAARVLGGAVRRAVLGRANRLCSDPEVAVRILDRRTIEYSGDRLPPVLRCSLGRSRGASPAPGP